MVILTPVRIKAMEKFHSDDMVGVHCTEDMRMKINYEPILVVNEVFVQLKLEKL